MGQLKEEQDAVDAMKAQIDSLTQQLLHVQKAFLIQQRELNAFQLETIERQLQAQSVLTKQD